LSTGLGCDRGSGRITGLHGRDERCRRAAGRSRQSSHRRTGAAERFAARSKRIAKSCRDARQRAWQR
jgi:hypothetical protein